MNDNYRLDDDKFFKIFPLIFKLLKLLKGLRMAMFFAILFGVGAFGSAALVHLSLIRALAAVLQSFEFISDSASFLSTDTYRTVFFFCKLSLIFVILRAVLRYLEQYLNHYIAFKLLAEIRSKVYTALRRLAPAKLLAKDKGDLLALISTDVELLEVFYAHTISPIVIAVVYSFIVCIYLLMIHWSLSLLAVTAFIVIGIIEPKFILPVSKQLGLKVRAESAELNSTVLNSLKAFLSVLQYKAEIRQLAKIEEQTDKLLGCDLAMKKQIYKTQAISSVLIYFFNFSILFLSLFLWKSGSISMVSALTAFILLLSSYGPVLAVAALANTLAPSLASGRRILNLLDEDPVVEENADGLDIGEFDNEMMAQICFTYPSLTANNLENPLILNNFSAKFVHNKFYLIQGPSGCGKTTILHLLARFYDPDNGKVTINDQRLQDIKTSELRKNVVLMNQDTYLFEMSIADNIRLSRQDVSAKEIEEACRKANIHDFIMSLPERYETVIGKDNLNLSSGEKQRIALARLFLSQAKLCLLDEPSSNLDSLNEALILMSILNDDSDKAYIMVSHRDSVNHFADEIIRLAAD